MKKILVIMMAVLLNGCLYGKNKDLNIPSNIKGSIEKKSKMFSIKNSHKISEDIYVIKKDKSIGALNQDDTIYYAYPNGSRFDSKSEIMIKFENPKSVDISYVETKYGLKFVRKMNSGDFLFKNLDGDTLDKIGLISDDEIFKIKRIFPNMQLNMKPF